MLQSCTAHVVTPQLYKKRYNVSVFKYTPPPLSLSLSLFLHRYNQPHTSVGHSGHDQSTNRYLNRFQYTTVTVTRKDLISKHCTSFETHYRLFEIMICNLQYANTKFIQCCLNTISNGKLSDSLCGNVKRVLISVKLTNKLNKTSCWILWGSIILVSVEWYLFAYSAQRLKI